MSYAKKRGIFLAVVIFLIAALIVAMAVIIIQGPRESSVELVSETDEGYIVDDLYEGNMTIPKYSVALNTYKPDDFSENNGVVTYQGGSAMTGINVNSQKGDIDWEQVAANGIDYAMIRVGFRKNGTGTLVADEKFVDNITGALNAGLSVGVYFYSKAVTAAEADEEASYVLEQIREYSVTLPVAIYWEYDLNDDGSLDEDSRTSHCTGEQITGFIDTFCSKIEASGRTAAFYCTKDMGYESVDLEELSGYKMWYAEFKSVPSFYYHFDMWQFTKEGSVPGISEKVPISLYFE